ncbi:MAG: transcription-repair coupling factor [Chloroflexi bacterium]|nr:transcription-repair coupling factor [Chloroflexota bacterium]
MHDEALGLMRSARLPLLAALQLSLERPILLLSHRRDRALTQFDELDLWLPEAENLYFPESSALFYENAPWSETTRRERLSVLARLVSRQGISEAPVITTSTRALMARTLPKEEFLQASFSLKRGERVEPVEMAKALVRHGYEAAHTVTAAGQFARRGGILDLWPMQSEHPGRLEFFGDEVESLRFFDPASQRTIKETDQLLVPPAREYLGDQDPTLDDELSLSEFDIPRLHKITNSLLDYLPSNAMVVIDDKQAMLESISEFEAQAVELRRQAIETGQLDKDFPLPYFTLAEIHEALAERQVIELGPAASLEDAGELAGAFRLGPRFGGQLKPMLDHIDRMLAQGDTVQIISRQAARLQELWNERYFERVGPAPDFKQGSLSEGWSLSKSGQSQLHLLSDGEIFGWDRPVPRRRPRLESEAPESPYVDLQNGELVVHIDHGIGIFHGMVQREIEGAEREFLLVQYAEEDQLYVPIHQADRLTRYVGSRGERPNLSRLGGVEWHSVKSRVQKAVEAIAEDLLDLYARREMAKGHSFGEDTPWQHELEASFPYIETEDQLRVIGEVKGDMESTRPMDRLVCGDAGYGKTEVALRASFKAVMDGKQAALLVPTTVLAQQHYETFRSRLAAFPVSVEMLSRFRTAKEQSEILARLASGDVDIVIGTHRLVQPDVQFKDLGLVIIDEEQRFGVTHKEHLKKLRTEVDVLTMTATPIPRTLYMALTGVRDISTINTPPEERLPVVTHVGPYSPELVRRAALRELDRGGQLFFVHNRVQTIGAMEQRIRSLVPEARVRVAHGQMAEKELAERMREFTAGEIDILLTTTIIESGLDIPNANTLIVDRADAFGLSQLYQLRGRVGRGAQRAYAYFFRHGQRQPTEEGRARMETIAENTQLRAGFSVAMRDLEIRGAGDLLGTRQHGLIAAVGFHLYTRLLTKAVQQIRKRGDFGADGAATQLVLYHPMINVDLPLEIGIPAAYVPDQGMRLKLYRRLADLHDLDEIAALEEEFRDRFGEPPAETLNLLYQLKIKVLAEHAGVISISAENKQLALRFPRLAEGAPARQFPPLGANVRASKLTVWLYGLDEEGWQPELIEVLQTLANKKAATLPA